MLAWQCAILILNCIYSLSNCRHKPAIFSLPTNLEISDERALVWVQLSEPPGSSPTSPRPHVRTMRICGPLPEDRLNLGVDIGHLHSDLHVRVAEGAARGVPTLCPAASAQPAVMVL